MTTETTLLSTIKAKTQESYASATTKAADVSNNTFSNTLDNIIKSDNNQGVDYSDFRNNPNTPKNSKEIRRNDASVRDNLKDNNISKNQTNTAQQSSTADTREKTKTQQRNNKQENINVSGKSDSKDSVKNDKQADDKNTISDKTEQINENTTSNNESVQTNNTDTENIADNKPDATIEEVTPNTENVVAQQLLQMTINTALPDETNASITNYTSETEVETTSSTAQTDTANSVDISNQTKSPTTQNNTQNLSTLATEKILSNVEFTTDTATNTTEQSETQPSLLQTQNNTVELSDEDLKKLLQNQQQTSAPIKTQTQPALSEALLSNIEIDDNTTSDIELTDNTVDTKITKTETTNNTAQTTNNQSKVVINLKDQNPTFDGQIAPTDKTTVNEDANTDNKNDTLIKTDSSVNTIADEAASAKIKEIPDKIKANATTNFEQIAGTDTTVVQAETETDAQTNNGSSFKENANEQIIKMSVKNASATPAPHTIDAFGAKVDNNSLFAKALNKASTPQELNKSDIMNQINAKFDDLIKTGSSKVSIVLRPENLGRIHLEIVNSAEGITAKMSTENQHVKEMLDKNIDALKASLGNQGVNVNNIKVEMPQEANNANLGFDREQFNHNAKHSQQQQQNQTGNHTESSSFEKETEFNAQTESDREIEKSQTTHNGKIDYKV